MKGLIKNPALEKIVSIFLVSSAGWIIFTKVTHPIVVKYLGDGVLMNVIIALLLILLAYKLIGKEVLY